MSQCPFWSTNKNIFNCYDECPMKNSADNEEGCVFQIYLGNDNNAYKNIGQSFGYDEDFEDHFIIDKLKISSNF